MQKRVSAIPTLVDLDARFRVLDQFDDYAQVLSLALPPIEAVAPPGKSAELARIANEELAALVARHPDRFVAAVAGLPLNDVAATLRELDHAVRRLGLRGVQLFTHINGKPLDAPEFSPVFEAVAELNVPIWLHPARGATPPDYPGEKKSLYEIWHVFGWPFDTTIAMTRMIFSGLLDRFPALRVITHHLGGTVPFLESRIKNAYDQFGTRTADEDYGALLRTLRKHPHDYYRMFYADTALYGSPPALECGLAFFGAEHVLFGSDMPFDAEGGSRYIRQTLGAIDQMTASPEAKRRILRENAVKLLGLEPGGDDGVMCWWRSGSAIVVGVFFLAGAAQAQAPPSTLRVGVVASVSDAGFFVPVERGYFAEQGLAVEFVPFRSAADMIAPLGVGQLDIGGGAGSAGLFNAPARGIDPRIAADKGGIRAGERYEGRIIPPGLVERGPVQTPAELEGVRIGPAA